MGGARVVVSVHDVAPPTASAARRWADLFAPLGVPLTFLAVPGPWRGARFGDRSDDGGDLAAWLRSRQQAGDEVSLHGWGHRADVPGPWPRRAVGSLVARGAAEFWALDRAESLRRTVDGLQVLADHGLAVTGTTPPGWLASVGARTSFRDAGLTYTTDHLGVVHLPSGRRRWAPAFCHRPSGGGALGGALEGLGRQVVAGAARVVAAGGTARVGLHPDDLLRPGLDVAAVDAVRACLDAGAQAATYEDLVREDLVREDLVREDRDRAR